MELKLKIGTSQLFLLGCRTMQLFNLLYTFEVCKTYTLRNLPSNARISEAGVRGKTGYAEFLNGSRV